MKTLKWNFRNLPARYDKRAICEIKLLYEVLNQAINEKIALYTLIYAYNNNIYSIGYEKVNNEIKFYFGTEDGNSIELNTMEELEAKTNYENKVTVLRELQSYDSSALAAAGAGTGAFAAKLFLNSMQLSENIMELAIRDNFMFKDFLVTNEDENFNYNLSDLQIAEFDNLIKTGEKNNKIMIFFVFGCLLVTVGIIVLCAIFGE